MKNPSTKLKPKTVFVVQNEHVFPDHDEVFFIGVYTTRIEAKKAVARLSKQPGFKTNKKGFSISEYELNKDHWTEGYFTYIPPKS
jgi:hypothetical protein